MNETYTSFWTSNWHVTLANRRVWFRAWSNMLMRFHLYPRRHAELLYAVYWFSSLQDLEKSTKWRFREAQNENWLSNTKVREKYLAIIAVIKIKLVCQVAVRTFKTCSTPSADSKHICVQTITNFVAYSILC